MSLDELRNTLAKLNRVERRRTLIGGLFCLLFPGAFDALLIMATPIRIVRDVECIFAIGAVGAQFFDDLAKGNGRVLMYDSEVHTMSDRQSGELHGELWLYLVHPVAVKVGYMKAGAPLHVVGHPWHPSRRSKIALSGLARTAVLQSQTLALVRCCHSPRLVRGPAPERFPRLFYDAQANWVMQLM